NLNVMNKLMVENIKQNMDEIIDRWIKAMREEKGERFFHFMPEHLVEKTSREFAELMTNNISEQGSINEDQINDFTEKVVRFGWAIKIVNKAIDNFSDVVFDLLEERGVIKDDNLRAFMRLVDNWINPLRESIIDAYSTEWERTVSLQKIALQELS